MCFNYVALDLILMAMLKELYGLFLTFYDAPSTKIFAYIKEFLNLFQANIWKNKFFKISLRLGILDEGM